jgi:hypothetical protein
VNWEHRDGRGLGRPGVQRYRRSVQVLLAANVVAAGALAVVALRDSEDSPRAAATDSPAPVDSLGEGGGNALEAADGSAPGAFTAQGQGEAARPESSSGGEFLVPPEQFLRVDDATAGTGPLGLEEVVRLDASDEATARSRFAELGFVRAESRAWQSPTDSLLVVAYEFADERGAATFADEAAALRHADPAAAPLPLPGVPAASAFQLQVPGDPTQVAFLARGSHAYLVGLVGSTAADPQAGLLHQLAALQYDASL